jgi:hypothetical protein
VSPAWPEQRRLRLRRRAVDLVGEHDVREDRPAHELEDALPGADVLFEDFGAGDVGRHEIRRELNAREVERQDARQRRDEQRLREPRNADQQAVAAREQRYEQLLDDGALPDDDLADLRLQRW